MKRPAAPGPLLGALAHPRLYRVLKDVRGSRPEMFVAFDGVRLKSLLEDMTTAPMAGVEALRVETVQALHSARQRISTGLEEQMVVSGHEAVDVARPEKGARRPRELDEEDDAVSLVAEELTSSDSAGRHVKHTVIEKVPWRARHTA